MESKKMKKYAWIVLVFALAGCDQNRNTSSSLPQPTAVTESSQSIQLPPTDYREQARLTLATVKRSVELFERLGNRDLLVYKRDIYTPANAVLLSWPDLHSPEWQKVPEALGDCREAAHLVVIYFDRSTMSEPSALTLREAGKDLAKAKEKMRLCDAALAS